MKITRKFFSRVASLACFFLILTALLATLGMQLLGDLKTYVQISLKNIQDASGYHITLDDIGWDIFAGTGIKIDNLVLLDADGNTPLFDCPRAHITFEILPLFQAQLIVSRITLDEPHIRLYRDISGDWLLPLLARAKTTAEATPPGAFSDFSISLKRFYINGGFLHVEDRQRNLRLNLEDIMIRIERQWHTPKFALHMKAREGDEQGGSFAFAGVVQGLNALENPEKLTGAGELTITSAKLLQLAALFTRAVPAENTSSMISAKLQVKLEPGWRFHLSGSLDAESMTIPLAEGTPLQLGKCKLDLKAQIHSGLLLATPFTLTLADTASITGTCSVNLRTHNAPHLDLTCSSNKIPAELVAGVARNISSLPRQFENIFAETTSGDIVIKDAHIMTGLEQTEGSPAAAMTAEVELHDVVTRFLPQLPQAKILNARLRLLADETLEAAVQAEWPDTDTHRLQARIESVFHTPRITLEAQSQLSARGAAKLLSAIAPDAGTDKLLFLSGTIAAKTKLSYADQAGITADIDFKDAALVAAGTVEKPEGAELSLKMNASLQKTPLTLATPISFTVTSGKAAKLTGSISNFAPFAAKGAYQLKSFDLSSIAIPDIRGLLETSGFLSGKGTWELPGTGNFPAQGSCSIQDFSLVDTASGTEVVGATIEATVNRDFFKVLACRAQMGETKGTLTGELKSLLPTRGRLEIIADLFDIDDFVKVIDKFIAVADEMKKRNPKAEAAPKPAEQSLLHLTDLDMPLKLKRLNLWNWDLENGTSLWTFKNGVMHWTDIILHGGGGPISGTVMFDLSKLPVRTLRLSPTKSQCDFLFVVPALRKNRTITGTMDMSGYFSTTFSRKEDMGRNMGGAFHITLTDGKLQKLTALSKIMELMNLRHFYSFMTEDLLSTGMPYDRITADFTVDHAVMKTENLQLNGPAMNLSATGKIDMLTDKMDLIVGAQILEAFGKIVGAIPLAGSIVTGKNKTITLAYFKVAGDYRNTSVMPMPIKSLSAPVLKLMDSLLYFPKKLLKTVSESDNATTDKDQ